MFYLTGIGLAFALRDNRAFCKILCPIPVLQKLPARFSMLKLEGKAENRTACEACNRACIMNVDVRSFASAGKRIPSSQCIQRTNKSTCARRER